MVRKEMTNQYPVVDLHRKKSEVLIIHCADPRFQDAYRNTIDGLGKYYDLLVAPGASKAVFEDEKVVENIKLLESLHHFEEIHIMDHIECGAFGKIEDEIEAHSKMLSQASQKIKEAMPNLQIVLHLLGEESELPLKPRGQAAILSSE